MDCSTPRFSVLHHLLELAQTHVHRVVLPSNHLIFCHPLLLLPSIFPSIRVFSDESALHIRWPKYWSFSVSAGPSNDHSRLISFRIDWLDLLAVQGILKHLLQHHSLKASILWPVNNTNMQGTMPMSKARAQGSAGGEGCFSDLGRCG